MSELQRKGRDHDWLAATLLSNWRIAVIGNSKAAHISNDALYARARLNLQEGKLPAAEADARRMLALAKEAQGSLPHSDRTGFAPSSVSTLEQAAVPPGEARRPARGLSKMVRSPSKVAALWPILPRSKLSANINALTAS
jgi:hypothetical protein